MVFTTKKFKKATAQFNISVVQPQQEKSKRTLPVIMLGQKDLKPIRNVAKTGTHNLSD